jgi:CheY-like chemotaxis protein
MSTPAPATVLVVDDDADTRGNLHDILSDLGYHVETAADGPAALALVRARRFDVALLDFKMPGMNGLELYRAIKARRPETVAVIVSAYTDPATRAAAIEAGVSEVLPKPIDFPALLGLVESAVGQPLVLVVDDDPDLCDNLTDLLRGHGYRVAVAPDTRTAAERVRDRGVRVVLVDMRLPDGDGSAVARAVREQNPAARTVLITGFRQEYDDLVRQAVDEGADAVCYKPFDVPHLLATLGRLTGTAPDTGP